MAVLPPELTSSYRSTRLLRESRGVETWDVESAAGRRLLKINRDPQPRFQKEFEFLNEGRHPGFPRALEWRQHAGQELYLREFLPGSPLSDFFGKWTASEIGRHLAQILRALAYLHFRGWAHGDLSASNILCDAAGQSYLIDLEFLGARHRSVGAIRGTPAVMAPELFWGKAPTIQTDLYAVGCLAYGLVCGHYPFKADSFPALLQSHALEDPPIPTRGRSGMPEELGFLILRLLAKEPGSRFAEANDVIQALNRALDLSEAVEPAPPKTTPREREKIAAAYSQQQEALRHLGDKTARSPEEDATYAELLLKSSRNEDLEALLGALPKKTASLYRGLLLNQRGLYAQALQHWESQSATGEFRGLLGKATAYYYTGRPEKAFQTLNAAPPDMPSRAEALLKNSLGNLYFFERRLSEAAEAFERALALARRSGMVSLEALVLMNLANVRVVSQEWEGALEHYTKAGELYAALGQFLTKARCDLNLSGLLRFFGHLERAEGLLAEAKAILDKHPQPQLAAYADLLAADLWKKRGDFERAQALLARAGKNLEQNPSAADRGDLLVSQAEIHLTQGEDRLFEEKLAEARRLAEESSDALLGERMDFLQILRNGLKQRRFSEEEISFASQKLFERGDTEFVLDNLLRAKGLAVREKVDWSAGLLHWGRRLADLTHGRLPEDYRAFFRVYYQKLWEVHPMKTTLPASDPAPAFTEPRAMLQTVLDWVRELSGELDLPALTEKILDKLIEYTKMERGFVIMLEDEHWSVLQSRQIDSTEFRENGAEQLSWSLTRKAIDQGRPLVTTDAPLDPRLKLSESIHSLNLRAILVLPFHFRGRTLGAVYLDSRRQGEHLEAADLPYLEGLAEILGLAVHNAAKFTEYEQALKETSKKLERARRELEVKYGYENIVGRSDATRKFLQRVDRVTDVRVPVLLLGESGVGKELVARAVHFNGALKKGPFIATNCSAIPEALVESELFGYERGAFTGALMPKPGLFEQANGGTLFLDEIGDMPVSVQAKLLRVLQDGEVRRLGAQSSRRIQVRIVAATHRNLREEIKKGRFREDLFFRLNVAGIEIPALRERREDIPVLTDYFLGKFAAENKEAKKKLSPQALAKMMEYSWPGNVRELENLIYNLCVFSAGKTIQLEDLLQKPELAEGGTLLPKVRGGADPLGIALDAGKINLSEAKRLFEKSQIERVLKACQGKVGEAAKHLGILRPQLSRLIAYHGLKSP